MNTTDITLNENIDDERYKLHLNTFLKTLRFEGSEVLRQCIFPQNEPCHNEAINAHFISKNWMTKTIAESGKVIVFKDKIVGENDLGTPMPSMEPIEIDVSNAAYFPGLCWEHDQLFQCVDNKFPQKNDNKELFYMTFRQVLRNMWIERNKLYVMKKLRKNIPSDLFRDIQSNMNYLHMRERLARNQLNTFEYIRTNRSWGKVKHKILPLPLKEQGIILSTSMLMMENPHNLLENAINLIISIYPLEEKKKLLIVFSMLQEEHTLFKQRFSELIHGTLEEKQQLISKLLLANGDGLIFRPSYWKSLPESRTIPLLNFIRGNHHPDIYVKQLPPIEMSWDWNFFAV